MMAAEVPFSTGLNRDDTSLAENCARAENADDDFANLDVKQRLSSIVHGRRSNAGADNQKVSSVSSGSKEPIRGEHSKTNSSLGPQDLKDEKEPQSQPSSFMAGSLMLSNSILDEVLNEKKMALLQSPEVTRFLQEMQRRS